MSSFTRNTLLFDFDEAYLLTNDAMVSMFHTLETSVLKGFLGCGNSLFEERLSQFLSSGSIEHQSVMCTIGEQKISCDQKLFAVTFGFPCKDWLSSINCHLSMLKKWNLNSLTRVLTKFFGKNKDMKIEFRLLNDIVAKSLTAKARLFDSFSTEKVELMLAIYSGSRSTGPLLSTTYLWLYYLYQRSNNDLFRIKINCHLLEQCKVQMGHSSALHIHKLLKKSITT